MTRSISSSLLSPPCPYILKHAVNQTMVPLPNVSRAVHQQLQASPQCQCQILAAEFPTILIENALLCTKTCGFFLVEKPTDRINTPCTYMMKRTCRGVAVHISAYIPASSTATAGASDVAARHVSWSEQSPFRHENRRSLSLRSKSLRPHRCSYCCCRCWDARGSEYHRCCHLSHRRYCRRCCCCCPHCWYSFCRYRHCCRHASGCTTGASRP